MNFDNLTAWLQVIQGVSGMLSHIFSAAQSGANPNVGIDKHVNTIHQAAVQIAPSVPTEKTGS